LRAFSRAAGVIGTSVPTRRLYAAFDNCADEFCIGIVGMVEGSLWGIGKELIPLTTNRQP